MLYWMDIQRLWQVSPSFCAVYVGIAILLPFGLTYLIRQTTQHNQKFLSNARSESRRRFLDIRIQSDDERCDFDGTTARILKQEERIQSMRGTMYGYSYTIYAQNLAGQKFMCLIRNDERKPFVKQMDEASAKTVLKDVLQHRK
jgi:hypothetical protein